MKVRHIFEQRGQLHQWKEMHMLPDGSNVVQTKSEAYQCIIYNLQTVMRGCLVWPVKGMEKSS